ncbi:branched-chain amino acid ABC transporter permease [Streptacidiphilus rugosus]|uniref:branched-chain amino acid ABC transporter permease n=1 Tax=Streptacidiphilus rugosus TaxID=405783 RepID=UPI00056A886B|nr:branched-chain amino acid ABC transporter permease [Streptacidiphilus rugosus]
MLQYLANGLTLGAVYALFAVSFSLLFGVLDILNLAQVSIFTLGAYLTLVCARAGLPLWAAAPVTMAGCGVVGVLLDQAVLRRLRGRPGADLRTLVAAIGLGAVLDAAMLGWMGPDPQTFPDGWLPTTGLHLLGADVTLAQILCGAVALTVMAALAAALRYTAWGRRVRAVAENPTGARVTGINVEGTYRSTVALSSVLGGLAGLLFVLQFNSITPDLGHSVELKGLAAIILGGMGSAVGSALGGLLLGLAEVATIVWLGADWKDIAAFAVILAVLLVRPRGLLGAVQTREA